MGEQLGRIGGQHLKNATSRPKVATSREAIGGASIDSMEGFYLPARSNTIYRMGHGVRARRPRQPPKPKVKTPLNDKKKAFLSMKLNRCFPDDLERAKALRLPLVLPVGNVEYHGPHCVCGCDTLIAEGVAEMLEREKELVLAPTVAYGPSSYAASGPEKGTISTDMDDFERHIYGILHALLEGGWRNIHVLIHHQYDKELLFPMTLCAMKAAKQLLFDFMERAHGRGWYARLGGDAGEMGYKNWITVLPVMSRDVQARTGYDHAGKYECSLLMALYPGLRLVRPELAAEAHEWFAKSAAGATVELGRKMIDEIAADLKAKIS